MVNTSKSKFTIVMVVLVLCAITVTTFIVTNKSADSPGKKEDKVVVKSAIEDLESIKDRIKKTEEYREYYRSETNNGITVVGTLMEQIIDIIIAILKQPLVEEAVSKHIAEKQDAIEIAEYIEMLGEEIIKEVEQTPLLRCGREVVETCETQIHHTGKEIQQCSMVEGDGDAPVNNCNYYVDNRKEIKKGMERAVANLYNKTLSIIEKTEEKDKIYRISKNLAKANRKQYMLSSGIKFDDQYMDDYFPQQSYMENIAMAHYKHLGKELSTTLGNSVNAKELTEDEKPFVRYLTTPQGISEDDDQLMITPQPPQDLASSDDVIVDGVEYTEDLASSDDVIVDGVEYIE